MRREDAVLIAGANRKSCSVKGSRQPKNSYFQATSSPFEDYFDFSSICGLRREQSIADSSESSADT